MEQGVTSYSGLPIFLPKLGVRSTRARVGIAFGIAAATP